MRHISLNAERLGTAYLFEQFMQILPTVHAAPADFALCCEPLAVAFGDVACLAEGLGDLLRIARRVFGPLRRAARRINAHDPVRSDAEVAELPADGAGFTNLRQKGFALFF